MEEPESARSRRRRTVMVTGRWVASAAVIAAMTAGTAAVNTDDDGPVSPDSISYADPPDDAA